MVLEVIFETKHKVILQGTVTYTEQIVSFLMR